MSRLHDAEPGSGSWRDEDGHRRSPISTGYESERSFAVGGRVVGESEFYAFEANPDCAVCREVFRRGWEHAMHGFAPQTYWYPRPDWFPRADGKMRYREPSQTALVELSGYECYRRVRGIVDEPDPFTEAYAERIRMEDQDEVTRKLEAKARRKLG